MEADSDKVWALMKELAIFENHIDVFAITPDIIRESGFRKDPSDFYCIVGEDNDNIAGIWYEWNLPQDKK
ncbi:hypothetical protein [Empedobacter brevis]|uniref:hypothetical protein n=1 Tax=Empedobacter brevis TaxID=247 RepID=UPI002896342D|nr:hypothetical protein [Empedobacter brevis]